MVLIVLVALLLAGSLFWCGRRAPQPAVEVPPAVPAVSSAPVVSQAPVVSSTPAVPPAAAVKKVPKASTPAPDAKAPDIKLHKELIPKNIEIVRCYYASDINPPGTTFEFDINGSGFTTEFEKMIQVEAGASHIQARNLRLVTANQIRGEMVVGPDAKTAFVYPRVLIRKLPVFQAPEPFAVIRPGEVLNVLFTSMEETGRAGRFRVFTNLTEDQYKQFRIEGSTPGITIADLAPQLPYIVEGRLQIAPGVITGDYGMIMHTGPKKVFERLGMIRIVRPNVGISGFIQGIGIAERFRRPGDSIDFYIQGSGFRPEDLSELSARVKEFDMGKGSFTYISGTQLRVNFQSPAVTPPGIYGIEIRGRDNAVLSERGGILTMVPPNWIAGVQVNPAVKPGGTSTVRVLGRDFAEDFSKRVSIELDEPGLTLGELTRTDPTLLSVPIAVAPTVAPGDYWLQLKVDGKKVSPPYGSIIKVETP